jgi:hypothetical protein
VQHITTGHTMGQKKKIVQHNTSQHSTGQQNTTRQNASNTSFWPCHGDSICMPCNAATTAKCQGQINYLRSISPLKNLQIASNIA